MDLKEKSDEQLRRMLNKNSGLSASEVRSVLSEMKSRGLETPPAGLVTGGRPEKAPEPAPAPAKQELAVNKGGMAKKKGPMQMAMGGMANGKKHMYLSNGGAVKDNAGLRALRASGPKGMEAYNKITKNK